MKALLSTRLVALAVAGAAPFTATVLVATAQAANASRSHVRAATGTLVALRKTTLGTVLVDGRSRTLYLFDKDRNGMSACNTACLAYWPALTSHLAPRAGAGVRQSLLRLGPAHNGTRQVIYAGHPLYTFAGDKLAGQTYGENLSSFGADWYAVSASGAKVEPSSSSSSGISHGGGY